jgi:TonB-dependent SusC/RagA subfamily outer membrane receptor
MISHTLFAQYVSVKGTVVSSVDNLPVIGASVVQKGTANGTITNADGNFSLDVPPGAVISISYIGFLTKEITADGSRALNITLQEDIQTLSDVVVTGYTSQKKADLTGAVSVVRIDEIENINSGNAMKSLQGRIPGVMITSSGSPDGAATVRIRGIGTLGNNDPLYIIDGVPSKRSMNELATADIESIQVLKDASSASIYGSRAANGVIIVTTKKGKTLGTKIDFRASFSTQSYRRSLDLLNTEQRGFVQWQAAMNDKQDPNFGVYKFEWHGDEASGYILDKVIRPEYLADAKTMRPAETDWVVEI